MQFSSTASSKRVRGISLCEASRPSRYSDVLSCVARAEEQIAGHPRIGRIGVHGVEIAAHEFAQIEPSRSDR